MAETFLKYLLAKEEWPSLQLQRETDCCSLLITGERNTWKTSLLFQCAVTCCEQRKTVVFITPEPFQTIPTAIRGMPVPSLQNMAFFHFVYIRDLDSFVQFFASFHVEWADVEIIMIDKFETYIDKGLTSSEEKQAFLFSLMRDAAMYLTPCGDDSRVRLVVTCDERSSKPNFFRFFSNVIVITPEQEGSGSASQDYIMKIFPFNFENLTRIKFHICNRLLHIFNEAFPTICTGS